MAIRRKTANRKCRKRNFEKIIIQSFGIRAIPRFILIDQLGNIIQAEAPQPSEEKEIRALIDAYLK